MESIKIEILNKSLSPLQFIPQGGRGFRGLLMKKNTVDIITLGCSKNLVDSEQLMRQFEVLGYNVRHDAVNPDGEVVIVNTCGFIGDAKEESINTILQLAEQK